jgi:hypothetical protein
MAHAQKIDFVFRRNERAHLNRQGRQFSRLLAGELCTSVCRGCTARASLCSAVMWRLLVTHSILLFPLHFSSRASPCTVTFQLHSTGIPSSCRHWSNNIEITGKNSFKPLTKAQLSLGQFSRNSILARQIFVKNSCTEIHENPTNDLVVDSTWRTDWRTGVVSTLYRVS